jgi:hypothetical protein
MNRDLDSVQHRADALFALPQFPRRVAIVGDPPGWRDDLRERGIEVVGADVPADVGVASDHSELGRLAAETRTVVVDGDRAAGPALRERGRSVTRLLTLPVAGTPVAIVDLGQRRAARYGIRNTIVHQER